MSSSDSINKPKISFPPYIYVPLSLYQSINLVFLAISNAFMIVSWNNLAALFFFPNNYIKDIFLFGDGGCGIGAQEATTCWFSVIIIAGDLSNFDM